MTPEEVRLLYEFDAWANHRVLDACAALTPEQFTQPLGSSFSSVRDTLAHIMDAQWLWLERWRGRSPATFPQAKDYPDLARIRTRWAKIEADLLGFVRSLTATGLERSLSYQNTRGVRFTNPLWQMLQHVVNHGSYHRGQATTLLRQLSARPVATDLIGFYRERSGQPLD